MKELGIGKQLGKGRFTLLKLLGKSEFSQVYLAETGKGEHLALKILPLGGEFKNKVYQLQREIEVLASLSHPHIVKFLESFYEEDLSSFVIVTEYVQGIYLQTLIEMGGKLDIPLLINVASQILDGLLYAHERNVIHCDIKPSNLLIQGDALQGLDNPFVKLIDFGLTTSVHGPSHDSHGRGGTPAYMAPEQLDPVVFGDIGVYSDLYSFGILLYQLATGKLPFNDEDFGQMIRDKKMKKFVPLHEVREDVPLVMSEIISKLLSPHPKDRYKSAKGLLSDMQQLYVLEQKKKAEEELLLDQMSPLPLLAIPPFIGRKKEVKSLKEAFARICQGQNGSSFFIGGEGGIGKSRLVSEFCKELQEGSAWILLGGSSRSNRNIPYFPLFQCLEQIISYLQTLPQEEQEEIHVLLKEAFGEGGSLLGDFFPPLSSLIPPHEKQVLIEPDQKREILFFELVRFLKCVTVQRPLIFVLDDLQWADEGTKKWVEYFERALPTLPVILIATYRTDEVKAGASEEEEGESFDQWLSSLKSENTKSVLLAPLTQTEVDSLVDSLFGIGLGDREEIAKLTFERSQGSPFYTLEFLKTLVQEGIMEKRGEGWRFSKAKVEGLPVTKDLATLVGRRISRLSEKEREILHIAALLGRSFSFDDLVQVSVETAETISKSISQGIELQMLRMSHNRGYLEFTHDHILDGFYHLKSRESNETSHEKIGYYLEAKYGEEGERLFELARHFSRASDKKKAFGYLLRAGDYSHHLYANSQAVFYYEEALRQLEVLPDGKQKEGISFHIYECLGDAEFLLGHHEKAEAVFAKAIQVAPSKRDVSRIERRIAVTLFNEGALGSPVDHLVKGLHLLGFSFWFKPLGVGLAIAGGVIYRLVPLRLRRWVGQTFWGKQREARLEAIRSYSLLTTIFYFAKGTVNLIEAHLKSLNLAESVGESKELAEVYLTHGFILQMNGLFKQGLDYVVRGRKIYEKFGDNGGAAKGYCYEGYGYVWGGEWNKGIRAAEVSAKLLESVGNLWQVEINYANWAFAYIHEGEFDIAIKILRDLRRIIQSKKTDRGMIDFHNHIALAYARKGHLEQAWRHALEAEQLGVASKQRFYLATTYTVKSEILLEEEKLQEANQWVDQALEIIKQDKLMGDYAAWPKVLKALIVVKQVALEANASPLERKRRLREASLCCKRARRVANTFRNHKVRALSAAGFLLELKGNWKGAGSYFRKAIKISEEMGSIYGLALAKSALGGLLVRENEKNQEGVQHLLHAEKLLKGVSATIELARVRRLLNFVLAERELPIIRKTNYEDNLFKDSERLKTVFQVGSLVGSLSQIDQVLESIMDETLSLFSGQRGVIILHEEILGIGEEKISEIGMLGSLGRAVYLKLHEEFLATEKVDLASPSIEGRLVVKVARHIEKEETRLEGFQFSRTIVERVFRTGEEVLIVDALSDPALNTQKSIILNQLRSIMCVPFRFNGRVLGAIYLDNSFVSELFTKSDLELLKFLAIQAAIAIENAIVIRKFTYSLALLKEFQRQLVHAERLNAMGELVARVSHEINNPLAAIAGYAELLGTEIEKRSYNKGEEYCEIILKEARRCHALAKEILGFGKVGIGTFQRMKANHLLKEVIKLASVIKPKNIALTFSPASHDIDIMVDRSQMHQVLLNLITNAFDATEAGEGCKIHVSVASKEKEGEVYFMVEDDGCGLPLEVEEKIFEPFFTTKEKGTGLGLSIARHIIHQHNGEIRIQRPQGKGTCFVVSLPLASDAVKTAA